MKLTICFSKTVLIFYSLLAPIIIFASLYNLVKGVIMGQTTTIGIGPFSLFGFILLPTLIYITYRKNKCVFLPDKISIGNVEYLAADYTFYIQEKQLLLVDRPIVSLLRKTYYVFLIKENRTNNIVLEQDLNVFKRDLKKIKLTLLNNYGK